MENQETPTETQQPEQSYNPLETLYGNVKYLPNKITNLFIPAEIANFERYGFVSKHQVILMGVTINMGYISDRMDPPQLTVPMIHRYVAQVSEDIAEKKLNTFVGATGDLLVSTSEDPTEVFPNINFDKDKNNGNQE